MELRDRLVEAFRGVNGGPGHLADIALEALSEDPIWATLFLVYNERVRQESQYGHLNDLLQDGTGPDVEWLSDGQPAKFIQEDFRRDYEAYEAKMGLPTWMHLVREEIAEAFELEASDPNFVTEIIQVSALCASWAQRRK
jgi:hypothetical protein